MQLRGDAVPSWVCTAHFPTCRKNSTRNGEIMNLTSILYAIGFTLGFCLCLFAGWDADGNAFRQAFLVFAGFCFGGMAVMVIEALDQ